MLLFERGTATLTVVRIPKWTLTAFITYGLFNSGLYFLLSVVAGQGEPAREGSGNA